MNHLTKSESAGAYFDYLQPGNQIETDLVADMVAARWRLRRVWRYQTAMLDIEMDVQAPDFEKKFEKYDEDMRAHQPSRTYRTTRELRGRQSILTSTKPNLPADAGTNSGVYASLKTNPRNRQKRV